MDKDLTTGNPLRIIIGLAIPIVGSSFMQFAYNFTDMLWVGKLGSDAVVAVGTSGFFLHLGWAIAATVLMGCGIKYSQAKGQKDETKARDIASTSFVGLLTITALYVLIMQLYATDIIGFFQLNNLNAETLAISYLRISSVGLFFKFITMQFSSMSNASGDSKKPFQITSIGVVLNIILDPIFIFTLNFGVMGAAIATVIAQVVTATLFWWQRSNQFLGKSKHWNFTAKKLFQIMKVGLAPSVQYMIFSLVAIVMARIISQFGSDAIAAQKIGLQIEGIAFMAVGGLSGAILAFTGQNYGANKLHRIVEGYKVGMTLAGIIGICMSTLFVVFAEDLVMWFVQEENTVRIGASYLRIIGLSQLFQNFDMTSSGAINGMGKTHIPAGINTMVILLRIPLALWLSQPNNFGIDGVWYALLISTTLRGTIVTSAFFYLKYKTLR